MHQKTPENGDNSRAKAIDAETQFEAHRGLMFSIAYRMLGSAMEAEDIVQDAYLRYQAVPLQDIQSHRALLSTIVTRLCLNRLDLARTRRELYTGFWLPEPILTDSDNPRRLPEGNLRVNDSISLALLTLLESLTPVERAVFILHEVFDYSYGEIAEIVEKEETACRQLLSRAKKHIAEKRPRFKSSPQAHKQILDSFMQASLAGELDGLLKVLADDVVLWADGGGQIRGAATQPIYGADAVARFVLFSLNYLPENYRVEQAEVNGEMAIMLWTDKQLFLVISVDEDLDRIRDLRIIASPQKLAYIQSKAAG